MRHTNQYVHTTTLTISTTCILLLVATLPARNCSADDTDRIVGAPSPGSDSKLLGDDIEIDTLETGLDEELDTTRHKENIVEDFTDSASSGNVVGGNDVLADLAISTGSDPGSDDDSAEEMYTMEEMLDIVYKDLLKELKASNQHEKAAALERQGREATDSIVKSLLQADNLDLDELIERIQELEMMEKQKYSDVAPAQLEQSRKRFEEKLKDIEKSRIADLLESLETTDPRVEELLKILRGEGPPPSKDELEKIKKMAKKKKKTKNKKKKNKTKKMKKKGDKKKSTNVNVTKVRTNDNNDNNDECNENDKGNNNKCDKSVNIDENRMEQNKDNSAREDNGGGDDLTRKSEL